MKIGVELLLFPWVLGLLMAFVAADAGAKESFKSLSVQDTNKKNEYDLSGPYIRGGSAGQSQLLEAIRNLKKNEPKQESQDDDDDSEDDDKNSDENDDSEETETIVSTSKVADHQSYVPETVTSSSSTSDGTWKTQGPLCAVGAAAVALLVTLVASRRRSNPPQKQTEDSSSPENIIRYVLDPELLDDVTVATSSTNLSRQALCAGS